MSSDEMLEFEGMFICETDLAILFVPEEFYNSDLEYDEDDAFWLPKSRIEYEDKDYERKDPITVSIPEWLAESKELI